MIILCCWLFTITTLFSEATIDMNLSELQYLADHLYPEECRRLVAAIHFNSYNEPNALDQAERKVPKDVPCLQMLLHWNSAKGEGKGQTHEVILHRLNQLGRHDLANWLGKTVFHQLGEDLNRNMNDPFVELAKSSEKEHNYNPEPTYESIDDSDPTDWWAIDTICYFLITGLVVVTFFILGYIIYKLLRKKTKKRKRTIRFAKKQYEQIDNHSFDSGSESEERFNILRSSDAV